MSLKQPLIANGVPPSEIPHQEHADHHRYPISHELAFHFTPKELKELRATFAKFDANGDGSIDSDELAVIMEMIGQKPTEEELATLMKEADADGDGTVSFIEFCALMHSTKQNQTESKLLSAIKLASTRKVPSKYARLQSTRSVFGTNDDMQSQNKDDDDSVVFGVRASWAANVLLLVLKLFSYYLSSSQAILAALADSVVDLVSQFVLASGDEIANTPHEKYPVGRARIESLSVMCSATIMIVASVEVVQVSGEAISAGLQDHDYGSDSKEWVVFMLMSVGIFVKMVLQVYCNAMNKTADGKTKSEMLDALADDHLNDIWSNFAALGCLLTAVYTKLWWMDPAGAIVISAVIVYRWADIIRDQTEMMVGLTANDEMIEDLVKLAQNHDDRIVSIDRTIAYFFGSKYNVEMDIILPGDFSLEEAHDIGISLQNELEEVEEVARAIVHIDIMKRPIYEHKADRDRDAALKKIRAKKALEGVKSEPIYDGRSSTAEDNRQASYVSPTNPPLHDML